MPRDLSDLFGVTREGIRWERPVLIAAALIGADLFLSLVPSVSFHSRVGEPGGQVVWQWPGGADPPWLVLNLILTCLAAVLPFLGFLVTRRVWIVVPLAALIGGAVRQIAWSALLALLGHGPSASEGGLALLITVAKRAGLSVAGDALWLTCLALALVWIRSRAGALFAGLLVGGTLSFWWWRLGSLLMLPDQATSAAFTFLSYLLTMAWEASVALLLWAGLRLVTPPGTRGLTTRTRASRPFYAGSAFAAALVGELLAATVLAQVASKRWEPGYMSSTGKTLFVVAIGLIVLALIAMAIYLVTIMMILLYKAWAAIQDGHAPVSPGWAVGGLFIPLFNFYWIFRVWAGFPDSFNSFAARAGIGARLGAGLFIAFCVLGLLSVIPIVGSLCGLANVYVRALVMGRVCDAINQIPAR